MRLPIGGGKARGDAGQIVSRRPIRSLDGVGRPVDNGNRARVEHALEPDAALRRRMLTFVMAGGGFSGVEAIAEVIRDE